MPRQMVDPPLLPQLCHNGVYPGKACLSLHPLGECLRVPVPGDLDTHRVSLHLVKAGVVGGGRIEELPPQQLAVQGKRWVVVLLDLTRQSTQKVRGHTKKQKREVCKQCRNINAIITVISSTYAIKSTQN